jgi:hypothetical protein
VAKGEIMKRLLMILLIAGMLSAVGREAFAVEHFALSNVFTLNMRDPVPMTAEHFALSNVFTLNMRDMVPLGGLEHSALSDLFTLDLRDIPVVNVLSVGALTIKAKEIRQKSGDLRMEWLTSRTYRWWVNSSEKTVSVSQATSMAMAWLISRIWRW